MNSYIKSIHTVFSNVAYQMGGRIVTAVMGLVTTSLLTRHLGTHDFGALNLIFSIVSFIYILPDYGLQTLLVRETASHSDNPNSEEFNTILSMRIALTAITTVGLCMVVWLLPYSQTIRLGILLAAIGQVAYMVISLLWAVLQGSLAFSRIVIAQIVISLGNVLLTALGVFSNQYILYFVTIQSVAVVIGLITTWIITKRYLPTKLVFIRSKVEYLKLLRTAFPFAIGLIVSVAYFKIDTLILSFFYQPNVSAALGLYSLAYKPFEVIIVFGGFLSQTLYPFFSQHVGKPRLHKELRLYGLVSIVLALGAGLFLYLGAPLITSVLGGSSFAQSIEILRILALAASITILGGYFMAIALAGKQEKQLMWWAVLALLVNAMLNFAFVPQHSYIATSWATVITQMVIMLGGAVAAWRVVKKSVS